MNILLAYLHCFKKWLLKYISVPFMGLAQPRRLRALVASTLKLSLEGRICHASSSPFGRLDMADPQLHKSGHSWSRWSRSDSRTRIFTADGSAGKILYKVTDHEKLWA